jgi:hypothetical protein
MRRHTLITALLAISGSALWADAAERLAGDDLRKSVSGKTIYFATPIGAEIPIRYRPNGSMSAATSDSLAALGRRRRQLRHGPVVGGTRAAMSAMAKLVGKPLILL